MIALLYVTFYPPLAAGKGEESWNCASAGFSRASLMEAVIYMRRIGYFLFCAAFFVILCAQAVRADDSDTGPAPYAKFIVGSQSQPGLFTLWRKNGKVYIEVSKSQLGSDFIQSAAPANGLGGWALVWGEDMVAQTRLIRFTRTGN